MDRSSPDMSLFGSSPTEAINESFGVEGSADEGRSPGSSGCSSLTGPGEWAFSLISSGLGCVPLI